MVKIGSVFTYSGKFDVEQPHNAMSEMALFFEIKEIKGVFVDN